MPQINGEPEPTPRVGQSFDDIEYFNRHFDWLGRNQFPLPVAPPMRPDPTITPTHDCDFGAFDFVWRWVYQVIDWLNKLTGAKEPKPKRKTNGEQMATLAELFEGYEDESVPRAYRSSHPGWFTDIDTPYKKQARLEVPPPPPPPLPPYGPTRDVTRR